MLIIKSLQISKWIMVPLNDRFFICLFLSRKKGIRNTALERVLFVVFCLMCIKGFSVIRLYKSFSSKEWQESLCFTYNSGIHKTSSEFRGSL